jgi:nicotinamidase-related amidase
MLKRSTHPNLLDSDHSILVLVDMQTRLLAAMPEAQAREMLVNCLKLLQAATLLGVPVLVTEQYPKGLGSTEPEIIRNLPPGIEVFEKTGFSCCAAEGFNRSLARTERRQVILLGQEAHVCVLQTALELLDQSYQVYVLEDALCSRQAEHKSSALRRMRQHGGTVLNHESVLFEWLKDAKHPDFKVISSLIR